MATTQTIPPVGPYRMPLKKAGRKYHRKDDAPAWESNDSAELNQPVSSEVAAVEQTVYNSPRCTMNDEYLFPFDRSLYNKEDRWGRISEQAGAHRQDGSVLTLRRQSTPLALKNGMTRQAAARVRSLNLWLDHREDILPKWLDVIDVLFENLEHITLSEDLFPDDVDVAVSARMRRLYVLYRLPDLKSIDEMSVSSSERHLARPVDDILLHDDTNDKDEWMGRESLLDGEDDKEYLAEDCHDIARAVTGESDLGSEGELPRIPAIHSAGSATARELGVELNRELAQQIADLQDAFIVTGDDAVLAEKAPMSIPAPALTEERHPVGELPRMCAIHSIESASARQLGVQLNRELAKQIAGPQDDASLPEETLNALAVRKESYQDREEEVQWIPAIHPARSVTARESGVELDFELAQWITSFQESQTVLPDEALLAGEELLDFAVSSSGSGEQREDKCSTGVRTSNRDLDASNRSSRTLLDDAVEVELAGSEHMVQGNKPVLRLGSKASYDLPSVQIDDDGESDVSSSILSLAELIQQGKMEIESVASSHHEWTAACGVLAFRSDKACVPRLRLGFSGRVGRGIEDEEQNSARRRAKQALRKMQFQSPATSCSPVKRQSNAVTSLPIDAAPTTKGDAQTKFFPAGEAPGEASQPTDKIVSPSRSLSSPFPMQFRARVSSLHVSTSGSDDDAQQQLTEPICPHAKTTISQSFSQTQINSSPKQRVDCAKAPVEGELPPPCPGPNRRRVVPNSDLNPRKANRLVRRMKASQARKNSVLDVEDEDESDYEEENAFSGEEIEC